LAATDLADTLVSLDAGHDDHQTARTICTTGPSISLIAPNTTPTTPPAHCASCGQILPLHDSKPEYRGPRIYVDGELARQIYYANTPLPSVQARAITELGTRHGLHARGCFDLDTVIADSPLVETRPNPGQMRRLQTEVIEIERVFGARAEGKCCFCICSRTRIKRCEVVDSPSQKVQ
jgi:hypothetical protein